MSINERDIRFFLEICNSKSISEAALKLGVTQPALSVSIKRIEASLGGSIFIRGKSGVLLTRSGKQLLAHAKELSRVWEKICKNAYLSEFEISGTYTLGAQITHANFLLPTFLPKLLADFDSLRINIQLGLSHRITEKVNNMEIDIGVVSNPVMHPDLIVKKLATDEVGFWVSDKKSKYLDPTSGHAILICHPRHLARMQKFIKQAEKKSIYFKRIISCHSLEVTVNLAKAGAGIAILPKKILALEGEKNLKQILPECILNNESFVIYRVENKSNPSIQEIASRILSAATQSA